MSHQYRYISGKEIIARVSNDFTIDNSQWIYSAPLWIADALAQLKIPMSLQYTTKEIEVVDYKFEIPVDIRLIIAVEYNGYRLKRLGIFNNMSPEALANRGYDSNEGYELVGNGWCTTTFKEGTLILHYRIPPTEYDKFTGMLIPKVPDDTYVIEAINWYIILHVLYKGFQHPVFNLNSNNEFTNAGMQWEKNKKRARNSVNVIDADEREEISLLFRKFIQNYNSWDSVAFTGSGNGSNYAPPTVMESLSVNYNSTIVENILISSKYVRTITNESTVTILAGVHGLGANVIPVLFELVGGEYVKVLTEFIVSLTGDVTWNGSSVVVDGYIILI